MKKIIVFPTWILVNIFTNYLSKNHEWKNRKFKLKEWADGSTQLNDMLSILGWIYIIVVINFIIICLKPF